ncbi:carboxy-terminal domain cyclin [Gregarina niphandrodes]|uniref:Carboxy-terminal domain cyclin n=1 Tax=Gregarina niphandrodes TaxID=110365 RepID=A0A023AZR0_GRENI|nr:carboxy-terminal domain cyclin [Gregarina niphandrodes]EZG44371.1 carboxy-terminal domain cyclin [Gregarina niphandrodes]|eukprot:XP_011132686.1 carboxy-terminal domain cyclin [Gregarina niphandrodes]
MLNKAQDAQKSECHQMNNDESDENKFMQISEKPCGIAANVVYQSLDEINYSLAWFTHHRRRESMFYPWYPTLSGNSWEKLRLQAISNFWRTVVTNRISPITVHLAVWIVNKLFYIRRRYLMTREWFAGIVAVGLRIALKFEERPDSLWGIRKIWDVLPLFDDWHLDKRDLFLLRVETEALRLLDDLLDVPLAVQFFDKYASVGGWPPEMVKEYTSLGHFILALSSFASGDKHPLCNIPPSELAAAAVVLSVKIVNGDSRIPSYEFFPERFAAFTQCTMKQLQPAVRGLSSLLRRKPEEADILARVYPEWGAHEWQ